MRILHLIQRYWPAVGGAEIHLGELSAHLAADGHQVTIATTDAADFELLWNPRRRRIACMEETHCGVRIRRFPVQHLPVSALTYPGIRRLLWLLSLARPVPLSCLFALARFTPWVPGLWQWLATTGEQFDLVGGMTICFEPVLEAGLRFARRRGVPFVAYPLTHLGAGPQPGSDSLSRFYSMRHQTALVCMADAAVVVAGPGVDPSRVLGGDGARFRREHGLQGPVVASLAAMSYDKGTVHVVEAVRRLWGEGRSVELVLAGTVTEPF